MIKVIYPFHVTIVEITLIYECDDFLSYCKHGMHIYRYISGYS